MQHEPKLTTEQVLARAAARHNDEPGNARTIQQETVSEVMRLIGEDMYAVEVPDADTLLRSWVEQRVARLPKLGADKFKDALKRGDATKPLDLGTDWAMPVLVCGRDALTRFYGVAHTQGRIVNLPDITARDLRLMAVEMEINAEKITRALQEMQGRIQVLEALLDKHTNLAAYYESLKAVAG